MSRSFHVTGRVQGVAYRAWAQSTARRLGLTGWVRNRADGSVEGVVQGAGENVERFLAALHQGPHAARVEQVSTGDVPPAPRDGFDILR